MNPVGKIIAGLVASGALIFFISFLIIYPGKVTIISEPLVDNNLNVSSNTLSKNQSPKAVLKIVVEEDIPPQPRLSNPPKIVKAIYLTSWAAGSKKFVDYAVKLAGETEINAVVVDIKDYSGFVGYKTNSDLVKKYGAEEVRIPKINSLIKKFHDEGIYIIGRVTVFQDPILAKARPDIAIQSIKAASSTQVLKDMAWKDRKGLLWIDPSSLDAWNYVISIAKDASDRGFDEINFDYIRFPSDGNLNDMKFPFWSKKISESEAIRRFFSYLRENLKGIKISADLFGLATVSKDDLGIGQVIEKAYPYFDFVSPMVYPSHYASGVFGYKNPNLYPYEIVKSSIEGALLRLNATTTTSTPPFISEIRPWLQDFSLGATYDAEKVRAQIKAVEDAMGEKFAGFMLWSPSNSYTRGALLAE